MPGTSPLPVSQPLECPRPGPWRTANRVARSLLPRQFYSLNGPPHGQRAAVHCRRIPIPVSVCPMLSPNQAPGGPGGGCHGVSLRPVRVRLRTLGFHGHARSRTLMPQPSARLCTLWRRDTEVDLLYTQALVLCGNKSGARGTFVWGSCVLKKGPPVHSGPTFAMTAPLVQQEMHLHVPVWARAIPQDSPAAMTDVYPTPLVQSRRRRDAMGWAGGGGGRGSAKPENWGGFVRGLCG